MTPEEYLIDSPKFIKTLLDQRRSQMKGGIYHLTQIDLAYNTNRIEGSRLTKDQTRWIYETKTVDGNAPVQDVIETVNHFRLFNFMLDSLGEPLSKEKMKTYHRLLKSGTYDAELDYFVVGDWKKLRNEVGGSTTAAPEDVDREIAALLERFSGREHLSIEDIADFHASFEQIHPFQDGNGRIGRILMFEQCLQNNLMPFVVLDSHKDFYYRGLREYQAEPGFLVDTLKSFQDAYYASYRDFVPIAQ